MDMLKVMECRNHRDRKGQIWEILNGRVYDINALPGHKFHERIIFYIYRPEVSSTLKTRQLTTGIPRYGDDANISVLDERAHEPQRVLIDAAGGIFLLKPGDIKTDSHQISEG